MKANRAYREEGIRRRRVSLANMRERERRDGMPESRGARVSAELMQKFDDVIVGGGDADAKAAYESALDVAQRLMVAAVHSWGDLGRPIQISVHLLPAGETTDGNEHRQAE